MIEWPIFALTTRGLEALTMAELAALPGVTDAATAYRRVSATFAGRLLDLLSLHTADDVFLTVTAWANISHTRAALADFRTRAADLDLTAALDGLRTLRKLPHKMSYSLTANFVGKRNYSVPEIKCALEQGIAECCPDWHYVADDAEAALNLRLFIDHDTGLLGLRVGERPLHRRAYKQSHLPGSLKPPVAAAMLMLAGFQRNETILDPFCGSGTLVVEAGLLGLRGIGGDRSAISLETARQNAREAHITAQWFQGDATRLPLSGQRLDGIATNLPWGRQIPALQVSLAELYRLTACELRRVTKPGGNIVLLLPDAYRPYLDAKALGWRLVSQTEISLFGQTPSIYVFQNTAEG